MSSENFKGKGMLMSYRESLYNKRTQLYASFSYGVKERKKEVRRVGGKEIGFIQIRQKLTWTTFDQASVCMRVAGWIQGEHRTRQFGSPSHYQRVLSAKQSTWRKSVVRGHQFHGQDTQVVLPQLTPLRRQRIFSFTCSGKQPWDARWHPTPPTT